MRHGSLFSGIGGFDLAAEWMGWENIFHCEWNPFGQRVLKHYWPNAQSYHDITQTDFTIHRGSIDILTGGFPCQPYSAAGKRLGKEDSRHLWPQMLRAIREIAPKYVVGENVLGLTNWNGGVVFDEVHSDLESAGYEVQAVVIPAAACNAPHGRDRVWFVANRKHNRLEHTIQRGTKDEVFGEEAQRGKNGAPFIFQPTSADGIRRNASHPNSNGQHERNCCDEIHASERREYALGDFGAGDDDGIIADTRCKSKGFKEESKWASNNTSRCSINENERSKGDCTESGLTADTNGIGQPGEKHGQGKSGFNNQKSTRNDWANFPTQSPICGGNDGLPRELDGITFSKWRNESIKAYGNAIVPQVAYEIFKVIQIIANT